MEEGAATGGAAVTVDRTEEAMVGEATGAALSELERPYPLRGGRGEPSLRYGAASKWFLPSFAEGQLLLNASLLWERLLNAP